MEVPLFPSNFLEDKNTGESKVQGDLFPVNFFTPHSTLAEAVQVRPAEHGACSTLHPTCPFPASSASQSPDPRILACSRVLGSQPAGPAIAARGMDSGASLRAVLRNQAAFALTHT